MSNDYGIPSLAVIASRYFTVNTFTFPASMQYQLVLAANPQRWYVRFELVKVGGITGPIVPGPLPNGFTSTANTVLPAEFKFKDCPSILTGEWFALITVADALLITECIYSPE